MSDNVDTKAGNRPPSLEEALTAADDGGSLILEAWERAVNRILAQNQERLEEIRLTIAMSSQMMAAVEARDREGLLLLLEAEMARLAPEKSKRYIQ